MSTYALSDEQYLVLDVDARPNRNSRDCSYAVTQFGIVS